MFFMKQVESVVLQHPGISAVIVLGLPDARLTEMVVACIQLKDNWQWVDFSSRNSVNEKVDQCLSKEILQQFCKEKNLTGYLFVSFVLFSVHSLLFLLASMNIGETVKFSLQIVPVLVLLSFFCPS